MDQSHISDRLYRYLCRMISDTNGVSLNDTLKLLLNAPEVCSDSEVLSQFTDFQGLLLKFQRSETDLTHLLAHPVTFVIRRYFKEFPLAFRDDHIHLTGSLSADFIWRKLEALLQGPERTLYEQKILNIYGSDGLSIATVADVERLIRLKSGDRFDRYLKILMLAKLILTDQEAYHQAAWHMAESLHSQYNVGTFRLKFSYSRASTQESENSPHSVGSEEMILGLYQGLMSYRSANPGFNFTLSPCFRKETSFFDQNQYPSKKDEFNDQVASLLSLLDRHPELEPWLTDVDTVGDERDLFSKSGFGTMRTGMRKLSYRGFRIRSHHGEVWHTLNKGVQAVDNAMNIWHIDTLEHGLSLGINPNIYYQNLYHRVLEENQNGIPLKAESTEEKELKDFHWGDHSGILSSLVSGKKLSSGEVRTFEKIKFHHARGVEHYQHDTLNRMIDKNVSLTTLPSSNRRLTDFIPGFQDHPFSWWERKGVDLSVGTDNYITLNTDYIQELLSLLFSNPELKMTKLLMVATGEHRRPWISNQLWKMREKTDSFV